MSVDFGGITFARVKKEIIEKLSGIENIVFYKYAVSSYSSTGGMKDCRNTNVFMIETKRYSYCYVIENMLFSRFVSADRMVVHDKERDTENTYKLTVKDATINPVEYSDLNEKHNMLTTDDFIYPGSSMCDIEPKTIVIVPRIWISKDSSSQKKNSIIVEAKMNDTKYYFVFNVDNEGMLEFFYYDKALGELKSIAFETVGDKEAIAALKKADEASVIPWEYGNDDMFCFPVKIKFDFMKRKIDNEQLNDEEELEIVERLKENGIEIVCPFTNQHQMKDENGKYVDVPESKNKELRKLCEKAANPFVPKNVFAEYKDGTLTFNGPYDYISKFLVDTIFANMDIKTENMKLVIPGNIKYIDDHSFESSFDRTSTSLSRRFNSLKIEEGVTRIGKRAFNDLCIKTIFLPNTLEEIGEEAFLNNNFQEIHIPKNVRKLAGNAFNYGYIRKKIDIDKENEFFYSVSNNDAVMERATKRLIAAFDGACIPEETKIIGSDTFFSIRATDKLVIPEGVEIIEDGAFRGCYFSEVVFPETLKEIGENVFLHCHKIEKLVFPKGLQKIGMSSFRFCKNLKDVEIGADTIVEEMAFSGTPFEDLKR